MVPNGDADVPESPQSAPTARRRSALPACSSAFADAADEPAPPPHGMKTFRVTLRRTTVEFASVIVLAEDVVEAERVAKARGLADEVWWAQSGNGSGCAVDAVEVEPVD
jgi:hypothetical protein